MAIDKGKVYRAVLALSVSLFLFAYVNCEMSFIHGENEQETQEKTEEPKKDFTFLETKIYLPL
jgi:hypothetical protein